MNNIEKSEFRKLAREKLRENAPERTWKSDAIWQNLVVIEVFRDAVKKNRLMLYLDFDHEVETIRFLGPMLEKPGSKVIIPYCVGDDIVPYTLFSLDELVKGHFGILEPCQENRTEPQHQAKYEDIAVVLVPGLAFDPQSNRLGRGKGFYDRFLATLPENTVTIGLAFECQVFEEIPIGPEDRPVSMLVTEDRTLFRRDDRLQ